MQLREYVRLYDNKSRMLTKYVFYDIIKLH